ncbi:DUF1361 domain-containing protein [Ferruginibacter sp. SUN002]|uniref:DUF1361 domain-containing protein n=1 Tax=Ferruginibacter sp. SUN002 TaxID=2937789 RepID=UPI003D36C62F
MLVCRVLYADTKTYLFLLWNLFLAWIPFKVSLFLKTNQTKFISTFLISIWLLFFPNALYIVTDLIHLEQRQNIPIWYDAVLLFTSSLVGLIMAFASLYKVEIFLRAKFTRPLVNGVVFLCLFAGSFGVYLGRFLRWNSWDIVSEPLLLVKQIAIRCVYPVEHYRTWAVTVLLTCLFSLLYYGSRQLKATSTH